MRPSAMVLVLAVLTTTAARPAFAGWPNSPLVNLPVCAATGAQDFPQAVSDGAGGAFFAWSDNRSGAGADVYAQHVLVSGLPDPAWPAGGRVLCAAPNAQGTLQLVSDGAGGAIVAWQDLRSGTNYDIHAQRVLPSGAIAPGWPADGRLICGLGNSQYSPVLAPDGMGGAFVAWFEGRGATSNDVYAHHVLPSGALDPAWPVDGLALAAAPGLQSFPMIVSDGAGGALVTWRDTRGSSFDIYAVRVQATGSLAPGWPTDGRALCTATGTQDHPSLVADGAGGAIVAWRDQRSTSTDVYAHHVLADGTVDPAWPVDGRAICTATGSQNVPQILADGSGGALLAWEDARSGGMDLYAHHVLATGFVDPQWPVDGRALCTAPNTQEYPTLVSDGAGGAIVSWSDYRSGAASDIYAQHVLAGGAVDPAWPLDGAALSLAPNYQNYPQAASDGTGGAIVVWIDVRGGVEADVYAQRIASFAVLGSPGPLLTPVRDVPNDQGGRVKLSWDASDLDRAGDPAVSGYDVLRSVPPFGVAARAARGVRVRALADDSGAPVAGDLVAIPAAAGTTYWEYLELVPALHYVSGYSVVAPTTSDSLPGSNPLTGFLVVAHDAARTRWWTSLPAGGYSVDNLAPATPQPFTGEFAAGTTRLHWNPNTEADLTGYRLYRGTFAAFEPGPATWVAAPADTGCTDAAGAPAFYKLTAVDMHGNESLPATLTPTGTLDAGAAPPAALALSPALPNPARSRAVLNFTLPRAGTVRLAVHDLSGRLVRELASGVRPAGAHSGVWDLRDAAGGAVRPGIYFARLEAGGRSCVQTVTVVR